MEEQRGLDRIAFFSDAVVAIAMTLLVLPLVDLESELDGGSIADLLSDHRDALLTFALSFAVIARYWVAHHRIFRDVIGFDNRLIAANFLFLFSIVFLPFPTELIGASGHDHTAITLYIGTLILASGALVLILAIVRSSPKLRLAAAERPNLTEVSATFVALVIALALALAVPGVGLLALLILIPAGFVHGRKRTPLAPTEGA